MTNEELHNELAVLLGWHMEVRKLSSKSLDWLVLIDSSGGVFNTEHASPRWFPGDPDAWKQAVSWLPEWTIDLEDSLELCGMLALLYHYHLIIEGQYERNRYFTQLVPFGPLSEAGTRETIMADNQRLPFALAELSVQVLRIDGNSFRK